MYYLRKMALFLISQLLFMGLAFAQTHGTAAEAKALAEKAVAYVKSAGAEKAFEEFSNRDPKWVDKDLYVFAVKTDGTVLAHGGNKTLVGKSLIEMKDANGKLFIKEMSDLTKAKGNGWVDYLFTNPQTKKTEPKSSFVIALPGSDGFLGVGIYK